MASMSNPGGGYRKGSNAQEENLFRRTNLFQCIDDPYQMDQKREWSYPLPEFGGLYIKDAVVFRDSEENGYAFFKHPDSMSFIAA